MILHCVFCRLKGTISAEELDSVMAELADLRPQIPGMLSFQSGVNIDLEQKSQGFDHGFVMGFDSRAHLEAYQTHPAHQAAGRRLVSLCAGGADGIMVFDLDLG